MWFMVKTELTADWAIHRTSLNDNTPFEFHLLF